MPKIDCSVPILTLNSAAYLERCLESIKDFRDVFLLDGNSTDNTLAIAARYHIPAYKQVETDEPNVHIKDFTAMRLRAEQLAQGDWILFLDSDEFLTEELVSEIAQTLMSLPNIKVAFAIQKKYLVRGRKIEHAFNYPNYSIRLYNKKSGVTFKPGKLVHERLGIPAEVVVRKLHHCYYSELPGSYRECVRKDKHQLGLMKASIDRAHENRSHSLKMAVVYLLRALNIFYKSVRLYGRFGYSSSLPWGQVMRHVRNHLLLSWWRVQKALL